MCKKLLLCPLVADSERYRYAYQRLPHKEIVNKALKKKNIKEFPWPYIPNYVPVIYNYIYGDQRCKVVKGFPQPPPGAGVPCPQAGSGSGGGNGGSGTVGADDYGTGKHDDIS